MIAFTHRFAVLILLLTVVAATAADEPKAKPDAEAILGKWKATSIEADGQKAPLDDEVLVKFDADTAARIKGVEKYEESSYSLATDKDPKEIDFTPKAGVNVGKTLKGIYELKESTLRVCFAKPDGDRPKEFKSVDGVIFVTFERVKEEEKK